MRATNHGLARAAADEIEQLREALAHERLTRDYEARTAGSEIERLRNRITDLELKTFDLDVMARYEKEMSLTANANLTEALRLMEPVAEASEGRNPLGEGFIVAIKVDDILAIADFVKRMRGAPNE